MNVTLASIKNYVEQHGLIPVQIDSIPEGLSFVEPNIKIGKSQIMGEYVAFIPFSSWEDIPFVRSSTQKVLLELYNEQIKKHV